MKFRIATLCFLMTALVSSQAQSLEKTAFTKIDAVEKLIAKAEKQGKDALKEKMTLSTAKVFLQYANWDAKNIEENAKLFKLVKPYKDSALSMAKNLPDFERNEVIKMLDEAAETLNLVMSGKITRKPATKIDWAKVTNDGNQLTYKGRPALLNDYTWKPDVKELEEYHGNLDGFYLTPSYVANENGDITPNILSNLKAKPDGQIGFIFLNHKTVPQWALDKYPNFKVGERLYTHYDIDNPGARDMQHLLLKGTVPYMAGKKYSQLGYMLTNEPHWNTVAKTWATGEVSEHTKAKFRTWLKSKHASITALNKLWGSSFQSFDGIKITIPIEEKLQGTPQYYDWMTFNMFRVTDWFTFLHNEIRTYDPAAKTHIKVMPHLWSDNKRDHGLDFEQITKLTEIIGNDAAAVNSKMWGETPWDKLYAMDWREVSMSYDFFKSISPDKIIFNTEGHFLSTTAFRDLYQKPDYVRAIYWLAYTQGLNACQTWYWARKADGSPKVNEDDKGYAGSNNQQPRVINEVASTLFDLNANSEEITAMQHMKKPLRVFYSKTSAINKAKHMDDVFELYESLYFEGLSIGFATKDILNEQNKSLWEAVLVRKTEFVTQDELNALQAYLNKGGTVIVDAVSLKKDEYGQPLESLKAGKGTLINAETLADMKQKALDIVSKKALLPLIDIKETNALGAKGCAWKSVKNKDNNTVLSIVNLGKTDAKLTITLKGAKSTMCTDILKGGKVSSNPTLKPNEVFFVEVTAGK